MHPRFVRPLSEPERTALERLYRHGKTDAERRRAHFILLSAAGQHLKAAADLLGMARSTAGRALRAFEAAGVEGLRSQPPPGRPSRVTPAVRTALEADLQRSPRDFGFPTHTWTAPLLAAHLGRAYQIALSADQARRLLYRLGFRRVKPRHRLAKGDPEAKLGPVVR